MRPTVIAFHGDMLPFMNGAQRLRDDMGNPSYVDIYFRGHDIAEAVRMVMDCEQVYLIGYSRGGQVVAELASLLHSRIAGACVYEAPVKEHPKGDFPVLQIWNQGSIRRHTRAAELSRTAWQAGRTETYVEAVLPNQIRHTKFFLRHGFDPAANVLIENHIDFITQQKEPHEQNHRPGIYTQFGTVRPGINRLI